MQLVSVIVPIFNAEKYLCRCIETLINQSYHNIEIILIDDGSEDSSRDICQYYALIDYRIKTFFKDNGGVSSARNLGIEKASGKYLLFVDADDYVEPNYVNDLVLAIEENSCEIVICGIKDVFNNKVKCRTTRGKITGSFERDYFAIIDFLCVPVGKIYRKEIIENNNIRFLDNLSYAEDEVFNFAYYECVKHYKFLFQSLYVYEHHSDSLSDKSKLRSQAKFNAYITKLALERNFFNRGRIYKKEQILGEHIIRAVINMASLNTYSEFKNDVLLIEKYMYKNISYNKLAKMIFALLLNLKIIWPLYFGCKLRNYFLYEIRKGD